MNQPVTNNSSPSADGAQAASHPKLEYDLGRVVHAAMLVTMTASVSASFAPFVGWLVALPVAVALTYTFTRLVQLALGMDREEQGEPTSLAIRVASGAVAVVIAGITVGASSAALYRAVFATASALDHLEKTQTAAQISIDEGLANAHAASRALRAWEQASVSKAQTEAKQGGTCPERSATLGKPGPIAAFRREEAAVAADLSAEVSNAIKALDLAITAIPKQRAADYAGALEVMAKQNGAIRAYNTFSQGSAIASTLDALTRRESAQIRWVDGSLFQCGDVSRLELITQARRALEVIKKSQPITPLKPAIDLANPRETTIRGLLRSFTALAKLATFGALGSFEGDALMQAALKKHGPLNRETMSLLLAALIEIAVIASAAFARPSRQGGSSPFPFHPKAVIGWLEARARSGGRLQAIGCSLVASVFKGGINATATVYEEESTRASWATEPVPPIDLESGAVQARTERHFDPLYLAMGRALEPYTLFQGGEALIILPKDKGSPPQHVHDCRHALEYAGLARPVNDELQGDVLEQLPEFERRYRTSQTGIDQRFAVSRLVPAFSHALVANRVNRSLDMGHGPTHRADTPKSQPLESFH